VRVTVDRSSRQLVVDGDHFFAQGVCYAPTPVGQSYGDWFGASEPDTSIWTRDLDLMQEMGVNAIRTYAFNLGKDHTAFLDACLARGILVAVGFDWPASVHSSDAAARNEWKNRMVALVQKYKSHPAILMWLFGNEKNGEADTDWKRREHLSYVQEVRLAIHSEEEASGYWHPVCTTLMDLYLDEYFALESSFADAQDLWCLQLYRGNSFGNLVNSYPSNLPLSITEYGADAFDGRTHQEWSGSEQRDALLSTSRELRDGRAVVSGGFIFAFNDGWDKCGSPSTHDDCGSAFGNLPDNEGNEEWWGLYATAPGQNPQPRIPRAAVSAITTLWHQDSFVGITRLPSVADAYIARDLPTRNFGSVDEIRTKYHSFTPGTGTDSQSTFNRIGLVDFGVPNLPNCGSPQGIVKLTLRWMSRGSGVLAFGPLPQTSWDESTITWANKPSFSQASRQTVTLTSAQINTQISLVVDGWSLGQPLGLWLQPDDNVEDNNDLEVLFFSREAQWGQPEFELSCTTSWQSEQWWGARDDLAVTTTPRAATTTPRLRGTTTPRLLGPCDEGGSVWEAVAAGHSCGNRISWVMQNVHNVMGDLMASKAMVAGEYPTICGACGPDLPVTTTTTTRTRQALPCEEGGLIWEAVANGHSCGSRIQWLMRHRYLDDLPASKAAVAGEFPSICGACNEQAATTLQSADTATTSSMPDSCDEGSSGGAWFRVAEGYSCGARIMWVFQNTALSLDQAKTQVAGEYPDICGACASGRRLTTV